MLCLISGQSGKPLPDFGQSGKAFDSLRTRLQSAWNLGKTRFRRFPTFHFSTPKNLFWPKFLMKIFAKKKIVGKSTNCLFLRSYGFLDLIGRCASKSYPQSFDFQLSTTFGRGVKEIVSNWQFFPRLSAKNDFTIFGSWLEDACVLARRRVCPG